MHVGLLAHSYYRITVSAAAVRLDLGGPFWATYHVLLSVITVSGFLSPPLSM